MRPPSDTHPTPLSLVPPARHPRRVDHFTAGPHVSPLRSASSPSRDNRRGWLPATRALALCYSIWPRYNAAPTSCASTDTRNNFWLVFPPAKRMSEIVPVAGGAVCSQLLPVTPPHPTPSFAVSCETRSRWISLYVAQGHSPSTAAHHVDCLSQSPPVIYPIRPVVSASDDATSTAASAGSCVLGKHPLAGDIVETLVLLQDDSLTLLSLQSLLASPTLFGHSFCKFSADLRLPCCTSDSTPPRFSVLLDPESSGVDLPALSSFWDLVFSTSSTLPSSEQLRTKAVKLLADFAATAGPALANLTAESLESAVRSVLFLLSSPMSAHPVFYESFLSSACTILAFGMCDRHRDIFVTWLAKSSVAAVLRPRITAVLQQALSVQWMSRGMFHHTIHPLLEVLNLLHTAASISDSSALFTAQTRNGEWNFQEYYNDAVNSMSMDEILMHLHRWTAVKPRRTATQLMPPAGQFSICHYPFLLDPSVKARLMQFESAVQQKRMYEDSLIRYALFSEQTMPVCLLRVHRSHLVSSTLGMLASMDPRDLQKPLKVEFVGEQGVDEGGVRKEFFQIMVREVFDPAFGMFVYNAETTRTFWFNRFSFESTDEFRLIGILLGLALYNSIILDLHLPRLVYRKLLLSLPPPSSTLPSSSSSTTSMISQSLDQMLNDLKQIDPPMASSMHNLLATSLDAVDLGMAFEVTEDVFGETKTVELCANGSSLPVTDLNKEEFVRLVCKYYLHDSILAQFQAFRAGFLMVAGQGRALQLLLPEELELLLCGRQELDFKEWEKVARYEGFQQGSESRTVRDFWTIVHSQLTEEERKKLLFFITGCDRAPIKGLGSLPLVIQRTVAEGDRLPTAHTCFNHFLLPDYQNRDKLRKMLTTAISNAEGFGLM